jgi:GDSL-like Lipase/Acylhydrolase family
MKLYFAILFLAVLGSCCPPFLGDDQAEIAAIGDSILSGGGSACKSMPGDRGGTPLYLSEVLQEQICNQATSGTTIVPDGGYSIPRQYEEVKLRWPTVHIFVLDGGYNDIYYAWQRGELTTEKIDEVSAAMDDLLSDIHSDGFYSVLVNCHRNRDLQVLDDGLDTLSSDYSAYAAYYGFAYYDLRALMQVHPEYYYDSIHLNDWGHETLAAGVASMLH